MKRFLVVCVGILLSYSVWGYNSSTHKVLWQESIKHLERLGYEKAAQWYESLSPPSREGVMWPDLHTTTKLDGNASEYILCCTPGCADPGDGNGERKNLDVTFWLPFISEEDVRNPLLDLGYRLLGEEAMHTPKAAGEGFYAPGSYNKNYRIYIEAKCLWVRLMSLGPIYFKTSWWKAQEYTDSALVSVHRTGDRPKTELSFKMLLDIFLSREVSGENERDAVKWMARTMHFFHDISCPAKTCLPPSIISVGPVLNTSCVQKKFKTLSLLINHGTNLLYCDWIDDHQDTLLRDMRAHSENHPLSIYTGTEEDFPEWVASQLDSLAFESKARVLAKEEQKQILAKSEELKKVKQKLDRDYWILIGGGKRLELEKLQDQVKGLEEELEKLFEEYFYDTALYLIPRCVQVGSSILYSFYKIEH